MAPPAISSPVHRANQCSGGQVLAADDTVRAGPATPVDGAGATPMRPLGIRAKVLLLALLPAAVSALLLGGYQLLTATQALQQALDERGQAIADQLAPTAEYAVFSGNTPVLEQLAQAV